MLQARVLAARLLRHRAPPACRRQLHRPRAMAGASQESIVSVTEVAATRWLRLNSVKYLDAEKKERLWDMCERTTRKPESSADAVVVFAVLRSASAPPHTLLVKQFRPPMGTFTIELPAGLIDPGEDAATAALRELKEETGYVATVRSVSPAGCMSPGLTNETVHIVHVEIDCDAAENADGTRAQAADDLGNIEVMRVPLASLPDALAAHSAAGGVVYAGLWTLAAGMAVRTP